MRSLAGAMRPLPLHAHARECIYSYRLVYCVCVSVPMRARMCVHMRVIMCVYSQLKHALNTDLTHGFILSTSSKLLIALLGSYFRQFCLSKEFL